jgi:hypothetical protein
MAINATTNSIESRTNHDADILVIANDEIKKIGSDYFAEE